MDIEDLWDKVKEKVKKGTAKLKKDVKLKKRKNKKDGEDSGGAGVPAKPLKKPPVLTGAAAKKLGEE